jgi:glycosyltransferase involved in cell wall biosynthesis
MKLSVILPVYNEEPNIKRGTIEKIITFLGPSHDFEIVIVDDGSSDKTIPLIKDKYSKDKRIHIIEKDHEGKAYAIISGIKEAKGDVIFFTDFDLATPIDELDKLLAEIKNGYDIVIGSRNGMRKGAPLTRKILSRGMMVFRDIFIGLNGIHDTQCGFKAFKSEAAKKVIQKFHVFNSGHTISGPSVTAAFDLEFLYIAKKLHLKVKEVPVIWTHVESRNVNFVRDAYESMKDILKIRVYALMGKYK